MALTVLGFANIAAAIYFFRRLPANIAAFTLRALWRALFRLEVVGRENLASTGAPNVVAINHVSWLDAPIVYSLVEPPPLFAIEPALAKSWPARLFLRFAETRALDPARPLSLRTLAREAKGGRRIAMFLDTRAAVSGQSMKTYDAAALIADHSEALVTPIRIAGAERTMASRISAAYVGRRLLPKVTVTILPPRPLVAPVGDRGRARRRAVRSALYDRMSDLLFVTFDIRRTLFAAFEESAKARGLSRTAVEDPLSGALTLRMFRIGVGVLARKIAAMSRPGETIGVTATQRQRRRGHLHCPASRRAACRRCSTSPRARTIWPPPAQTSRIHLVLTSRAFVDKANLGPEIEAIGAQARIVWLEDMRAGATTVDKLRAALSAGSPLATSEPDDPAVVLFTSGSEGAPKGVALSHANLLANIAQIETRFDLRLTDICFNPLPIFHAFGLTGGLLLGLIGSMKVYLYPTPLHYRQIPELIDKAGATFLLGADTFLANYARNASAFGFRSLRYVIAGAEPVKAETRRIYVEKFGLRILEGYGVTEASPVLAVNSPAFNRIGTVGRFLPFVEPRVEPVPGIEEGGRLVVGARTS